MNESECWSSSSCPYCSATSQQSRELDVVVVQVDPLDASQSCVAEESLQVVSHLRLAIGQGREGQSSVIAQQADADSAARGSGARFCFKTRQQRLQIDNQDIISTNTLPP